MIPLSKPRSPAEELRLIDAWRDTECTTRAVIERFKLSPRDVRTLKSELGPKARPGPISSLAITAQIKVLKARREATCFER